MGRSGGRFVVFLFNLIIAVLCAASIVFYFIKPFWAVKINYTLDAEALEKLLKDASENAGDDNSDWEDVDFEEIVGEDGVSLTLSVELRTTDAFSSFTAKDPKATVEKIIGNNVDSIVEQLLPTIDKIAENATRSFAKKSVRAAVKEQIRNYLQTDDPETDVSDDRIQNFLDKAGFDEEYIEEKTNNLIDALYEENASTSSVSEKVITTVEEVFGKLQNEPEFADAELTEENKEQIRDSVAEALSLLADDEGNIDMEDLTARIFLEILRSGSENKSEENGPSAVAAAAVKLTSETDDSETVAPSEEENAKEELKKEIRQLIADEIPENASDTVVLALKIIAGVLCFEFFVWGYLILKMLFKLFSRNPAVKLKLPIWLGWLPYLVLVLLPSGALALFKAKPDFFAGFLGAETVDALGKTLSAMSISFSSAGLVSFIAAIALILISIPYGILRRSFKD